MKIKLQYKIAIAILTLLTFIGCPDFVVKEKICGNYYLVASDAESEIFLAYHEPDDNSCYYGVIEKKVFAVGYDDSYIIAKQRMANKIITNYFILPIKKKMDWKNTGLIGPLTLDQFNKKKQELRISPDLDFTILY